MSVKYDNDCEIAEISNDIDNSRSKSTTTTLFSDVTGKANCNFNFNKKCILHKYKVYMAFGLVIIGLWILGKSVFYGVSFFYFGRTRINVISRKVKIIIFRLKHFN